MAKGGVDDAMFCEACGAHRDQLGVAGENMQPCPDCGRATCANCWNQVAGGCLSCRAFALPVVETPATRSSATQGRASRRRRAATVAAAAATKPKSTASPRRFKRGTKPQPDPVVTQMPASSRSPPLGRLVVGAPVRPPLRPPRPQRLPRSPPWRARVASGTSGSAASYGRPRSGRPWPSASPRSSSPGSSGSPRAVAGRPVGLRRCSPASSARTRVPRSRQAPTARCRRSIRTATAAPGDPTVTPQSTDPQAGPGSTDGGPSATLGPGRHADAQADRRRDRHRQGRRPRRARRIRPPHADRDTSTDPDAGPTYARHPIHRHRPRTRRPRHPTHRHPIRRRPTRAGARRFGLGRPRRYDDADDGRAPRDPAPDAGPVRGPGCAVRGGRRPEVVLVRVLSDTAGATGATRRRPAIATTWRRSPEMSRLPACSPIATTGSSAGSASGRARTSSDSRTRRSSPPWTTRRSGPSCASSSGVAHEGRGVAATLLDAAVSVRGRPRCDDP